MRRSILTALALAAISAAPARADVPVSLRGSNAAMARQHSVALDAGYTFVRTPAEMEALVASGELVRLYGNEDYGFRAGVRSLVARPETEIFIERLARDYRAACGEQLIVTSLTRPMNRQPRNSHRLSVHPAGIAVDLRVSQTAACRSLARGRRSWHGEQGLLDGIRERNPPHYHVALFPEAYMATSGRSWRRSGRRSALRGDGGAAGRRCPPGVALPETEDGEGGAWRGCWRWSPSRFLAVLIGHRPGLRSGRSRTVGIVPAPSAQGPDCAPGSTARARRGGRTRRCPCRAGGAPGADRPARRPARAGRRAPP
jgi:hypothetical protein